MLPGWTSSCRRNDPIRQPQGDLQLSVCFAARTDVGRKRRANEDFFAVDEALRLFVVADGLGGHVGGRTASELACYRFCEVIRGATGGTAIHDLFRRAYHEAHCAIEERVRDEPDLAGMGTTLVSVAIDGDQAYLGHIGDSRIYLYRSAELHLLTQDHSLVEEMVFRGQLSADDARNHPYKHVITRALGVSGPMEPDLGQLALEPGDVLCLCSDGISGPIDDDEIRAAIEDAKGDLGVAADALIDLANARGGEDNATIILIATN